MTQEAQKEKAAIWAEMDATDAGKPAPATTEATVPTAPAANEAPKDPAASATGTREAEVDHYAGVPQIVRDELAGLKSMFERTTSQLDAANGKIGGLNRQLKELTAVARTTKAEGGDAPTASAIREAQGSAMAMAKLKEDYPEFGAAMEAAMNEQLGTLREQLAKAKPASDTAQSVTPAEFEAYKRGQSVEQRHPGWTERVKTPAFAGWLQAQPRELKLLASSDDPRDAVRLLDLEREARKDGSTNRETQRLDSAAAIPTGRASAGARMKPVEQMTKAEYWQYLDEQDKAKQAATA